MVDIVTNAQQAQQAEAAAHEAEAKAAEEMAQQAQEQAVQDNAATEEAPSSQDTTEWDDLLDDNEDETLPEEAKAEEKAEEPVEEEPPVEEVATEEVSEEQPAEEPKAEETEETPEVEIPEEQPEQETRTPEEIQSEITKAREDARKNLQEQFAFTDEQKERFEEDPSAVLSEMAANLFMDLYDSISQGLRTQMPGMVNGIIAQQNAVRAHQQQFYNAWPQLAKAEYKPTVDRITAAYRQQNPQASNADAIKEIGAQAWVALRLPLDELLAHTQGAPAPQPAPEIQKPAHVPASAGNAPLAAKAPAQPAMNDWEQLATEFINEDNF